VSPATTTTYYARVTTVEGCQSALTPIQVTVNPTPELTLSSTSESICASAPSLNLSTLVSSVTNGVVHYYSDAACTSELGSTTVTTTGTYYLRAENTTTGCRSAAQALGVSLKTATAISTPPTGGATCAGTDITMTVSATGQGTLSYQWKKDGTTDVGTNSASYATSTPGSYTVTVTGECGPVESTAAVITNKAVTDITAQPQNVTVCAGNTATLSVTATGEGTVTCQWYNAQGNTAISGATNATYSPGVSGNYYVKVNAGCGEVTSSTASVTINPLPVPTIASGPLSVLQGQTATYTTESGMSNYFWSVTNGSINSGQGTASISVTWSSTANSGTVSVTYASPAPASCAAASPTTGNVTIGSQGTPTFTGGNFTVCPLSGNSYTYTTQTGMFDYEWIVTGGATVLAGGTGTSNTITLEWPDNTNPSSIQVKYRTVNDANVPKVSSSDQTVTKQTVTGITTQPSGNTVCYGDSHTMNVAASCQGTPTYTWYKDGTAIPGSNSASYTANQTGDYTVEVSATCGTATSNAATVTVRSQTPATLTGPETVYSSQQATYTAGAGSSYQWSYTGGTGTTSGGGNTADDDITITWGSAGSSQVKVSYMDGNGCATSEATKAVTINPAASTITFEPASTLHLENGDYTLAATAENGVTVKFRIDGSTAAANIDANANTLLHLLQSGSVTVTAYTDYQAAEVSRTIAIVSANTNVSTVTVSNATSQHGTPNLYLADCGVAVVQIVVTPEESGSQVIYNGAQGNSFDVDISRAGIHEVNYTVRSTDGSEQEYMLQIERPLAFDDLVGAKFNNLLYVNNNSADNGGYTFTHYQWYRNGQPIGIDQQYYSAGPTRADLLDPAAEYSVAVTTAEGKTLHVCPGKVTLKQTSSLRAYPNPVQAGKPIRLESDATKDGSVIRIYTITGGLAGTQQMFGNETQLTAPQAAGVYLITVDGENVKIRVE
jgi:hypothetical protein